MSTLGLNMLGDRGRIHADFVSAARRLGANYNLVMNNPALAGEVRPHCRRGVIYRHWPDDNAHRNTHPREFVRLLNQRAPHYAYLYLGNEPYAEQTLADWTYEALDECDRLGRRGVILNFPTGNPEPAVWEVFRPVLRKARERGHLLGLHEYFDVSWRKDYPWHVGRWERLLQLPAAELPEIVITELGCAVGMDAHRGYLWGGRMTDESYAAELLDVAAYYRRFNISATVFCMGSESDDWGTFSLREPAIEIISKAQSQEKPPVYTWIDGTCVSVPGEFVNVRAAASLKGQVVSQLAPGMDVQYSTQTEDSDGYRWAPVNWNGATRWVATLNLLTGAPVAVLSAEPPAKPLVWSLPVDLTAYTITGQFGEPRDYDGDGVKDDRHEGIDFAPAWLTESSVFVRAMADGVVESVRDFERAQQENKLTTSYGCFVRIRSTDGEQDIIHWYCHLSLVMVKAGESVLRGQVIGVVGSTGNSTGNHLHITIQAPGKGQTMGGLANVIDPATVLSELA